MQGAAAAAPAPAPAAGTAVKAKAGVILARENLEPNLDRAAEYNLIYPRLVAQPAVARKQRQSLWQEARSFKRSLSRGQQPLPAPETTAGEPLPTVKEKK